MRHVRRSGRDAFAFTLVELLVVIAIIGMLVVLLLPAVQAAREAARRTQCLNNLKQAGLAVINRTEAYAGVFPPGGVTPGPCCSTKSFESWTIEILPFLEEQALYDAYDHDAANEDPQNAAVRETLVPKYACPSEEDTEKLDIPESGPGNSLLYARGSYRGNAGRSHGEMWWDAHQGIDTVPRGWVGPLPTIGWEPGFKGPVELRHVTDGTSKTFLVGEMASYGTSRAAVQRRTFWAYTYTSYNKSEPVPQSRTLLVDYTRCVQVGGPGGSNPCKRAWGSYHPNGLQFVYIDGSCHFVSRGIDMEVFASMGSIAGNETTTIRD